MIANYYWEAIAEDTEWNMKKKKKKKKRKQTADDTV